MISSRPFDRLVSARPGSSHDQLARILGVRVLSGDYAPGANLPPEAALMASFSVSRTVLREVMKTLSAKGLVEMKTRVGTRVAAPEHWNLFDAQVLAWRVSLGLDNAFLLQLADVRRAIEPVGAALAAKHRTAKQVAAMRRHVATMAAAGAARDAFAQADLDLHLAIAEASGNPLLRSIGAVIEAALYASFSISSPAGDAAELAKGVRAHADIVDAIENRKCDAAAEAMRRVIDIGLVNTERAERRRRQSSTSSKKHKA